MINMYHYYNMVDLNNNLYRLNNLYQLNLMDNNNDIQLNLTKNMYHHFDMDKMILIVIDYQYMIYNLKTKEKKYKISCVE